MHGFAFIDFNIAMFDSPNLTFDLNYTTNMEDCVRITSILCL